jgi:IS5 family transposase
MSKQLTLGEGFEKYAKTTRRAQFLSDMDRIVPWAELCELIAPAYPVAGNGRPPRGLELMLRIYFLQQWFNLSDPAAEDALYDSAAMRRFVGLDLGQCAAPDETTICRFRHLLEQNALGEAIFQYVLEHLDSHGIKVGKGTIVDASIISASPSTKNKDNRRDPDMHQTKKGNQWFFGMKAHIGVDSRTKVIHAVAATAANVHDATCLPDLLHGDETRIWGASAYQGQGDAIRECAPNAQDMTNRRYRRKGEVDDIERAKNKTKSSVRAKVEHPFLVIKRIFGFAKTRYKGLDKNAHRLFVTCALTNLYLLRRRLLRMA